MKKIIKVSLIMLSIILAGIIFSQYLTRTINFHNRVQLSGTSHRIVVVANPSNISGGTIILDETFSMSGSSTTINASIFVEIE